MPRPWNERSDAVLEAGAVALALRGSELQSLTRHATALAGVVWLARSGCGHTMAANAWLIGYVTSCTHGHIGRSGACAIGPQAAVAAGALGRMDGGRVCRAGPGWAPTHAPPASAALTACVSAARDAVPSPRRGRLLVGGRDRRAHRRAAVPALRQDGPAQVVRTAAGPRAETSARLICIY